MKAIAVMPPFLRRSARFLCPPTMSEVLRSVLLIAVVGSYAEPSLAQSPSPGKTRHRATATPIEHLIVIVGENQSFDSLFATYTSPGGASVRNLLSQRIINSDGAPGPRFTVAAQNKALPQTSYTLNPPRADPYSTLPQPRLIGVTDQRFKEVGHGVDTRFPDNLAPGPFQITRYVPYPRSTSPPTLESSTAALAASTGDPVHRF